MNYVQKLLTYNSQLAYRAKVKDKKKLEVLVLNLKNRQKYCYCCINK
jgi:hypothetical protein